jgi:hypothetical protein
MFSITYAPVKSDLRLNTSYFLTAP